jgi:Hint domain
VVLPVDDIELGKMASISFWVRGDSTTANNNELNPIGTSGGNGVPAFQLSFVDDDPDIPGIDTSGDLNLDGFNGLTDPDTMVLINGVRYPFTFTVQGTLPTSGQGIQQVPVEHRGDTVGVIRVVINGTPVEYFFILDGSGTEASMNAFGQGAIGLTNLDFTPCFCTGTMIATPSGPRAVERLRAGDMVLNDQGEAHRILWIGCSRVSLASLRHNPSLNPVRIPANAFGPSMPDADLFVSPQHRIVLQGHMAELLFGEARVLAAAKHLIGAFADKVEPDADVDYFHILTEGHEILVSNGLPTESFQPARRMIDVMAADTRAILEQTLSVLGRDDMLSRKDALLSLKRHEAQLLAELMQRPQVPRRGPASITAATLH